MCASGLLTDTTEHRIEDCRLFLRNSYALGVDRMLGWIGSLCLPRVNTQIERRRSKEKIQQMNGALRRAIRSSPAMGRPQTASRKFHPVFLLLMTDLQHVSAKPPLIRKAR
jgi:hypothetical protein